MAGQLKTLDSGYMLGSITSDTESTLPRQEHDCDESLFLGTIDVLRKTKDGYDRYDLWVHQHEHSPEDDELILREGPYDEYASLQVRWARQISEDKKFKLAVEMYDRWEARGRLPRRTQADLAPQLRELELSRLKDEIRLMIAGTDATEAEKLRLLAEVMSEVMSEVSH